MARKTRQSGAARVGRAAAVGLLALLAMPADGQFLGGVRLDQPNVLRPSIRGRVPQPVVTPRFPTVRVPAYVGGLPRGHDGSGGIDGSGRFVGGYPNGYVDPRLGIGGSGVRVRVGDDDDNFQLRVNLGGGYPFYHRSRRYGYPIYYPRHYHGGFPVYPYHPAFPYPRYVWSYPVEYETAYQDPRVGGVPPAPPPVELTDLERARVMLARGLHDAAIAAYRDHLAGSELDAIAVREMAVALLDAGRMPEGIALLRQAYELDPLIVGEPIDRGILGGGKMGRLGRVLSKASRHANRVESASAWLTVTALIQAQDRDRVAARNAERAIEAGIGDPIADQLRRHFGLTVARGR